MSKFNNALADQVLRTAAVQAHLRPGVDKNAQGTLNLLHKANTFMEKFKRTNGFTQYHPAFIAQFMTVADSLVTGRTLSVARGNGRMATVTDFGRNNGCGLRRAGDSIFKLFDLEVEWVKDERTLISYPLILGGLPKSRSIFEELQLILNDRDKYEGERRIRKTTRESLLLKPHWNTSNIIGYTIEALARSFAFELDAETRKDLVLGSERESVEAAFKTLRFANA